MQHVSKHSQNGELTGMIPYTLVVFAHIAAAAVLVGGSLLAAPGVRAAVRRAGTAQEVRNYLTVGRPLSVINPVAALLVLVTGIYLTSVTHWWHMGWVQIATVVWFLNSVTARAVVEPAIHRLSAEAAVAADGAIGERLHALRWSRRWSIGVDLLLANDAAVLYLMTAKPALLESILVVAVVNALLLATGAALRRSRAAGIKPSGAPPLAPAS